MLTVGVDETNLTSMTRELLLHAWTDITVGETAAKVTPVAGYDAELERRRLDYEVYTEVLSRGS